MALVSNIFGFGEILMGETSEDMLDEMRKRLADSAVGVPTKLQE